jgi:hypothetical protein
MISIGDSRMKASIWSWADTFPTGSDAAFDCANLQLYKTDGNVAQQFSFGSN